MVPLITIILNSFNWLYSGMELASMNCEDF